MENYVSLTEALDTAQIILQDNIEEETQNRRISDASLQNTIDNNRNISENNHLENRVRIADALIASDYQDYISRGLITSLSDTSATNDVALSNAFIAADTVLSNVLTAADSNNYEALSANIESESIARKQNDEANYEALDTADIILQSNIDNNRARSDALSIDNQNNMSFNASVAHADRLSLANTMEAASNEFVAANTVLTSNDGTISNMMVDVKFESDNARTVLVEYVNSQLDGSIVSNNSAVSYGLEAAGSIGEFSSYNSLDGTKTNSTIERILQELAGSSIGTHIGDGGSAIDRIAQELSGSYNTNAYYLGSGNLSDSAIDKIGQELSGGSLFYRYNLGSGSVYESAIDIIAQELSGSYNLNAYYLGSGNSSDSAIDKIAQELDVNNHEQLTSLNVSVESSGSAVDILVDAVSELDSSLYQTQQTNHTQAVAIQSLNTARNDLYALIAALQNQITTLSSKVNALENHQNMGQTTNWWDDAENFENIASNLVDGRVGSTVVSVSRGQASLQMNLETTSNLTEGWEPATNVNVVIPVGESDSQFFRMGFE